MGIFKKKLVMILSILWIAGMFTTNVLADNSQTVRDFPGWNGSGTKPVEFIDGSYDCWDDYDDDDDDDEPYYQRGWRYSPAGWWYQYSDGTWPYNTWMHIDGRWYRFNSGGHLITGWYTGQNGAQFYLNPVDDGTLGAMRVGWQIVNGKAYYFNTMSDGSKGKLLTNTVTPDGYQVGADGALSLK